MWGLSPVVASGGHSSSRCTGLSLSRPLLLRSTGSRRAGSVIVAHGPSCSAAYGIFPDQGSNLCPLHWQADSQPLRHQGSPIYLFELVFSFSSDIYPGVDLLDHIVVVFLIFWGTSTLFSIVAVPIYILTNRVLGFLFLHILANTLFFKWHGSHLGFHHASISQTCI